MRASSTHTQVYFPANVTEGDTSTYWESQWAFPQSLTVDLGSRTRVARIVLNLPRIADWTPRTQTVEIYGSVGSAVPRFTIVPTAAYAFSLSHRNEVTINFTPVVTRFVTLYYTAVAGWPGAQLSEILIYG